jgi:hypothetical protein
MRIGVIGPTDIDTTSTAAGLDPAVCKRVARGAGESLARSGFEVVVVPDRGVGLLAAEAYRNAGGRRLVGIIPQGGTFGQQATCCCDQHRHLCHEIVDDLEWTAQHERICQLSDVLLCIGLSCGTISEIAWTKWVGNTPVVIIEPLVSGIPPEMVSETDLHCVESLDEFYEVVERLAQQ